MQYQNNSFGEIESRLFEEIGFHYGRKYDRLITKDNIVKVYGKPLNEFSENERKGYSKACYRLEECFETYGRHYVFREEDYPKKFKKPNFKRIFDLAYQHNITTGIMLWADCDEVIGKDFNDLDDDEMFALTCAFHKFEQWKVDQKANQSTLNKELDEMYGKNIYYREFKNKGCTYQEETNNPIKGNEEEVYGKPKSEFSLEELAGYLCASYLYKHL